MESLSRPRPKQQTCTVLWGVAAFTLIAAALRFWRLDQLPPGLFHDEAFNGLDVLRILSGWHPIYFPGNFGREPLYLYLVAGAVAALGRTPGAIRVVSALLGTLTIPAAYLAACQLFNQRIGLLTAAITAITLWHVALSRVGFRAISLPLISALAIWQGALAWRTRRIRHWMLAGALIGLTFYTYLSARFIPVALAIWGMGYWVFRPALHKTQYPIPHIENIGFGLLAAFLVAVPLGVYAVTHADEMLLRMGQVSVLSPQISGEHPWRLLARQTFDTVTMFFWHGDENARHNVPGRAVFDPVMAAFFLIGLAVCVHRDIPRMDRHPSHSERSEESFLPGGNTHQAVYAFVLIWTGVLLLPSILAESAPSFLRAVGVLPVAFMIPAVGLDTVWTWLNACWGRWAARSVVSLALITTLAATISVYFGAYSTSRALHEAFDAAPVEMAVDVNRWLGAGWQGKGLTALNGSITPGHYVWMAEPLWNFSIAVPFLVTESPTQSAYLHFTSGGQSAPGTTVPADAAAIKLVVQPTDDRSILSLIPRGWRIRARNGSTVGGVPGQEPFLLYVSFEAEPAPNVTVLAHFGDRIELVSQEARLVTPGKLVLRTEWHARESLGEDLTLFAQIVRDGRVVAQRDGLPADGLLPTSRWRVGDVIVDERELTGLFMAGRDEVRIGLYHPDTLKRLPVRDATGRLLAMDYWPLALAR